MQRDNACDSVGEKERETEAQGEPLQRRPLRPQQASKRQMPECLTPFLKLCEEEPNPKLALREQRVEAEGGPTGRAQLHAAWRRPRPGIQLRAHLADSDS